MLPERQSKPTSSLPPYVARHVEQLGTSSQTSIRDTGGDYSYGQHGRHATYRSPLMIDTSASGTPSSGIDGDLLISPRSMKIEALLSPHPEALLCLHPEVSSPRTLGGDSWAWQVSATDRTTDQNSQVADANDFRIAESNALNTFLDGSLSGESSKQ